MQLAIEEIALTGVEKAGVLSLCIGEERGSRDHEKNGRTEIQAVIQAMSLIGNHSWRRWLKT